MGDIWPYKPPHRVSFDDAMNAAHAAGFSVDGARVMAAIATAESGRDVHVINDTPATGDYSIGAWQINYYGSLYAGRVSDFGTPKYLVDGGIERQAKAAHSIWASQGLGAWSTYTSGAYKQYLNGGSARGQPIGAPLPPVNIGINPPTEDYSPVVRAGGNSVHSLGNGWDDAATVLRKMKAGRHG